MKLIDMLNKLYEASSLDAEKDEYDKFLESLNKNDLHTLECFGESLKQMVNTERMKRKLSKLKG